MNCVKRPTNEWFKRVKTLYRKWVAPVVAKCNQAEPFYAEVRTCLLVAHAKCDFNPPEIANCASTRLAM